MGILYDESELYGVGKKTPRQRGASIKLLATVLSILVICSMVSVIFATSQSAASINGESLVAGEGEEKNGDDGGLQWVEVGESKWVGDRSAAVVGVSVGAIGDCIVIATGMDSDDPQNYFFRFTASTGEWVELKAPRASKRPFGDGTVLAWDGSNCIYALFGDGQPEGEHLHFSRYSIQDDDWESLKDTKYRPKGIKYHQGPGDAIAWVPGSGLGVEDDFIYAILGGPSGSYFARYSINNNEWQEPMDLGPSDLWANTGSGASLVWTGGQYLYAFRGEYEEGTPTWDFARFNLVDNSWEDLPTLNNDLKPGGISAGASLVWPGSGDYIYALGGARANGKRGKGFYRYSISGESWEQLENLPKGIDEPNGPRLAYVGGDFYAWRGRHTTTEVDGTLWKYMVPVPDFEVKVSPSKGTIPVPGGSINAAVKVKSLYGYAGEVALNYRVSPEGAGITITFDPVSGTPTFGATMYVTTTGDTPTGDYVITVIGTGSDGEREDNYKLKVGVPDFTVSVDPTEGVILDPGGSVDATVTVTGFYGYEGTITLDNRWEGDAPAGVTIGFNPTSVEITSGEPVKTSTMTITTEGGTPLGEYTVTILGTGGKVRSTVYKLVVGHPDFTISVSPSQGTIPNPGDSTTAEVTVKSVRLYEGTVTLESSWVGEPPVGITISFDPNPVEVPKRGEGTSTMTVTTTADTPAGEYTVTILGRGGDGVERTTTYTLKVAQPDFTVSVSPSGDAVKVGGETEATVEVGSLHGYDSEVTLSRTINPEEPTITVNFSLPSGVPPFTSVLTIETLDNTPANNYVLTIKGRDANNNEHTAPFTLTVVMGWVKENIPVREDAWVYERAPAVNYGAQSSIYVGDLMYTTSDQWGNPVREYPSARGFLKFELRGLENVQIVGAKLWLYVNKVYVSPTVMSYSVEDDAWWEEDVNWNNQPSYGSEPLDNRSISGVGWYDWDVTSFVQDEFADDNKVSFAVITYTPSGRYVVFTSRESQDVDHRPYLELELTQASTPYVGIEVPLDTYDFSELGEGESESTPDDYFTVRNIWNTKVDVKIVGYDAVDVNDGDYTWGLVHPDSLGEDSYSIYFKDSLMADWEPLDGAGQPELLVGSLEPGHEHYFGIKLQVPPQVSQSSRMRIRIVLMAEPEGG